MKITLGKFVIGASMAISLGAVTANPAQAGTLTGAIIGGTAANDYDVYVVDGINTKKVPDANKANFLQEALTGNSGSPTGNVELRASSELAGFDFTKNTSLSGKIGDKDITLSSLILSDWNTANYKNTGKTFAEYWFNEFYNAAGLSSKETQIKIALGLPNFTPSTIVRTAVFNTFKTVKGLERSSDPNISYVNQDDNTGLISIGLAGHLDLKAVYSQSGSPFAIFKNLVSDGFQASEVVKYDYNGVTDYLYSFTGTASGLTDIADRQSHNANYEVTIQGVVPVPTPVPTLVPTLVPTPVSTPEPSVMIGVFGVMGIMAAQRKLKKSADLQM